MKCPFCAEEIQDEAILCRFCGAVKGGAGWNPPAPASHPPAATGLFSRSVAFRTAAVFMLASAALEVLSVTSAVPLFGAMRAGPVAVGYHLVYVALFLVMGVGLWVARPWGYWAMIAGTIYYSLDRGIYLLDHAAREAELRGQIGAYGGMSSVFDKDSIAQLINLFTIVFVVCWLGFLVYIIVNRSYFARPPGVEKHR